MLTVLQTVMGSTIPAATISHNLWYEITTFFFFSIESGLVLDNIIPRLSPQTSIGNFTGKPKDLNIYHI